MKIKFKHKKTGDVYIVNMFGIINCTNANDGQLMVAYHKDNIFFVREQKEFFEKFEKITNEDNKLTVICESCGCEMKDDGSNEDVHCLYTCPNCDNTVSIYK